MRGLVVLIFGVLTLSMVLFGDWGTVHAEASPTTDQSIEISKPYAFATSERQRHGAIFFTVRLHTNTYLNDLNGGDRIIEARADVSEIVELHTHILEEDGVMRMRKVEALEIPQNGELVLKPRADHIMLIGLNRQLIEGETIPLTLEFEKAGVISIEVPIIKAGTQPPAENKDSEPFNAESSNSSSNSNEDHLHHDHH